MASIKRSFKHPNFILPALDTEIIPKIPSTHKTSKSVSLPKIPGNLHGLNLEKVEKTITDQSQDKGSFHLGQDLLNNSQKAYNSPMKRLIKFADNNQLNLKLTPQKPSKNQKNSLKTPQNKTETKKIQLDSLIKQESSVDLSILMTKRELVLYWAKIRNSRRILDQLLENIWLSTKLNSLKLLTDTIYLIGDLYLCDGNVEGALYTYLHMKILCDLTQNFKMKLHSVLALANCCKILKRNTQALFLYKKALEYVWIVKDEEIESKIYDRIGMIYFHFGEIRKARYYHDRSLEYRLESEISPSKYSSAKALQKYHESLNSMRCDSVTTLLLSKLGISFIDRVPHERTTEDTFRSGSKDDINSQDKIEKSEKTILDDHDKIIPKVKFGTNLNVEALMENIFYEKDFSYEIPSPRYPRGYTEQDILLGRTDIVGINKRPKGGASEMVFSLNQLNLINTNLQKNRKPVVKIDLDPMQMKIPIADKIKLRNQIMRHLKNKEQVLGNKLSSKQKIKSSELLGFGLFYNHLTPNRNLEAFNYHFKSKTNKLDKYYSNLIMIEDSEENHHESKEYKGSMEELESVE